MNDPKRYRLDPESYLAEHPQGDFIDYQDYARIKAENARLKTEVEHLMVFCNCTLIPNKELQAKVERLTKAIDLTIIDLDERHERQDLRAWEFAELLRKAKGVQS